MSPEEIIKTWEKSESHGLYYEREIYDISQTDLLNLVNMAQREAVEKTIIFMCGAAGLDSETYLKSATPYILKILEAE